MVDLPDDAVDSIKNAIGGIVAGNVTQVGSLSLGSRVSSFEWPTPSQLPADVDRFVDRDSEIAQLNSILARALKRQSTVVPLIVGTAGVGKTALAVHWAHSIARSFLDGSLYVNLRGFDPRNEPLSPTEVLNQFIRAISLAGSNSIPTTVDERAGLFRTLTQSRRILIILDNAVSAEQVRPLIPGSPLCLVVVTSRNDLPGLVIREGAIRVTVPMLSKSDSVTLLSQLLPARVTTGNPQEQLLELAERCAQLPIALRVAADVVARSDFTTLSDVIHQLKAHSSALTTLRVSGDRDAAVESVFSWSYHALSSGAARLFRLVGLHPGASISMSAAAALAGMTNDECSDGIDELTTSHLLREANPGRYRLHDLLRTYAIHCAYGDESDESRREATGRVLSWYLHSADAANRVLAPHRRHVPLPALPDKVAPLTFADYDTAMRWCEEERLNLSAATRAAENLNFLEIAWKLPSALFSYLYVRGYFDDWIELYTVGARVANRIADPQALSMTLNRIGVALKETNDFHAALPCFERALAIRRVAGDRSGEATTLSNIGLCQTGLGKARLALSTFRAALRIARAAADTWTEAWTLHNFGTAQLSTGDLDGAQRSQEQALLLARQLGDNIVEGLALQQLGVIRHALGNLEQALATHQAALQIGRQLGHRTIESSVLFNTAESLAAKGMARKALGTYTEASILFEAMGNRDMTARALTKIANLMESTNLGRANEVQAILERAATLAAAEQI